MWYRCGDEDLRDSPAVVWIDCLNMFGLWTEKTFKDVTVNIALPMTKLLIKIIVRRWMDIRNNTGKRKGDWEDKRLWPHVVPEMSGKETLGEERRERGDREWRVREERKGKDNLSRPQTKRREREGGIRAVSHIILPSSLQENAPILPSRPLISCRVQSALERREGKWDVRPERSRGQ